MWKSEAYTPYLDILTVLLPLKESPSPPCVCVFVCIILTDCYLFNILNFFYDLRSTLGVRNSEWNLLVLPLKDHLALSRQSNCFNKIDLSGIVLQGFQGHARPPHYPPWHTGTGLRQASLLSSQQP